MTDHEAHGAYPPGVKESVRSPAGLLAAAMTLLLPIAFSPAVGAPYWSPKAALLLVAGGFGLPMIQRELRSRSLATMAASAFATWALVSAAASRQPVLSYVGLYNWGTGAIFIVCVVSLWTIGRHRSEADLPTLEIAVVLGLALNAVVAIAQVSIDLSSMRLGALGGRAPGLLGNPVHLGAFAAAAIPIAAFAMKRSRWWTVVGLLCGLVIQLSGGRLSLLLGLLGLVVCTLAIGWRHGLLLSLAVTAGIGLGLALPSESATPSLATTRMAATEASSATGRLETWRAATSVLSTRPILGHGPGRIEELTTPRRTDLLARSEGAEHVFVDAHNLVFEYSATTGLVGLGLLVSWLVLASRRARGPFAIAAGLLLVHMMMQPQSVAVTPLAALWLGIAAPWSPTKSSPRWPIALASLGAIAATMLLKADLDLRTARLDFDIAAAARADAIVGFWPEPAAIRSKSHFFEFLTSQDAGQLELARLWGVEAAKRDPVDPAGWNTIGELELATGRPTHAVTHLRQSLAANPWSARALVGLARAEMTLGRTQPAIRLLKRAVLVTDDAAVQRLLEESTRTG